MEAVCDRLTNMPWSERQKQAKDLGELLVVAHAVTVLTGRSITLSSHPVRVFRPILIGAFSESRCRLSAIGANTSNAWIHAKLDR